MGAWRVYFMYESYLVLIPVLLTGICIFRFPNAPMGYVELDQHPESLANLSKLVWSTRLISLVQFILSALDLWFTKNLFMAAMALNWFILIWIATGLHRPSNVEQGSHLALFLVLIGNFIFIEWRHNPYIMNNYINVKYFPPVRWGRGEVIWSRKLTREKKLLPVECRNVIGGY